MPSSAVRPLAPDASAEAAVSVRELTRAELDEVVRLERICYRDPWPRRLFVELMRLRSPRWGAFSDEVLTGYLFAVNEAVGVHLLNLAVSPPFRGNGIARGLLRALIRYAAVHAKPNIFLEVAADNEPAKRLYRAEGFLPVSAVDNYYGVGKDALVMERVIGYNDNLV